MSSRSAVSLGIIVKNFLRMSRHPWIGFKLASLEAEKRFFNVLYPHSGQRFGQQDPTGQFPHHRPLQSALSYLRSMGRSGFFA